MAGFHLTTGAVGPQVANNFLTVPLVVLLAVLVGIGCAVLGAALAGALFLALGMRRHLRGARPETKSAAADAVGADALGVPDHAWRSTDR